MCGGTGPNHNFGNAHRADHLGAAGVYFALMQVGSTHVGRRIVVLE